MVEDEDSVRELVARALSRLGHSIDLAADGLEGLELIEQAGGSYDLVVSDIRMPAMDGLEMARAAAAKFPGIRIILATGYAHQREAAPDLDSIIVGVIQKPFTLADIRDRVSVALQRALAA